MRSELPAATARYALDGRAAIVTGASHGIGRAVAERLVREGAAVCAVAAPSDAEALDEIVDTLRAGGGKVLSLPGDVSDPATTDRAVEAALRDFGRLDYVVSNAGIYYSEHVLDAPIEHFDQQLAVNVRGSYLVAVGAARAMATTGAGAIVCTASTASVLGEEDEVAYNTSKAAIAGLVRSLGVALAPYGIRVNAVAPGWVNTRLNDELRADPALWSMARSRVPLDRMASTHELAAVMVFLLSEEASYVTGATLYVDGGLTAGCRTSDWSAVTVPMAPRPTTRRDERSSWGEPAATGAGR